MIKVYYIFFERGLINENIIQKVLNLLKSNNFKNKLEPVHLSFGPALEISLEILFLFYLSFREGQERTTVKCPPSTNTTISPHSTTNYFFWKDQTSSYWNYG